MLSLVATGAGAALVPELALLDRPSPHVQIIDLPGLGARRINAVTLTRALARPAVQALSTALSDVCTSTADNRGTDMRSPTQR